MTPFYEIRKTELSIKRNTYEVNFPAHLHSHIEMLYVFKGAQHIKIENDDYCVNEGELAIIFPDIIHSYFQADKKTADELLIMCTPKLLGSLFPSLEKYTPKNPVVSKNSIDEEALFILSHLKPDRNFEVNFGYVCVLLSNIINKLILNNSDRIPMRNLAHNITEYIQNNFTENITRDSLAKTFSVNKYYISKIFKESFKMNLRSYLGLIRCEHAASLIRTTDRPLTDISLDSGFDSIRTFNRVFKDIYGISPRQFKNNIINYANSIKH